MKLRKHGFSIGISRVDTHVFLSLKAEGKLTHADYEVINPLIDSALRDVTRPTVDVFIDGTELEGWEPRAAWDDFKLGLKHGNKFGKVAIYGNEVWQARVADIANWFVGGEARFFDDEQEALNWLGN